MTQLWLELGLPGLALGITFAVLMLRKANQMDAKLVPFALGAWMAAFCLSLVAYNFWTDSLFSAFALSGLLFTMLDRNRKAALPIN
jgi:FtsH-binding integral membrane protein